MQMAAMLCCIFDKDQEMSVRKTSLKSVLPAGVCKLNFNYKIYI